MSKKNKHRHQQQPKAPTPSPMAQAMPLAVARAVPETPVAALVAISEANEAVVADATEEEVNSALGTPPSTDAANLDLVAAAKRIDETIALLKARSHRVAKREEELAGLEETALARDEERKARATALEEFERGIKEAQSRATEAEEKLRQREVDIQGREAAIRERELNAEAGFAAEHRASLKRLDEEAATLRDELSKGRAQIANERADWEAQRCAEDERRREEHKRAVAAHESALADTERASAEQLRVERGQLSKDRAELKKGAAQVELEHDILREDREAFDERVIRRAAHELEAVKAKQGDVEARLASAQASRSPTSCRQVNRTTTSPAAWSAASRARSSSNAVRCPCAPQPSVSTITPWSGQWKSTMRPSTRSPTTGFGSPAARSTARNRSSSSLRVGSAWSSAERGMRPRTRASARARSASGLLNCLTVCNGVVTRRPWRRVVSSVFASWMVRPRRLRGLRCVHVTSANGGIEGMSFQRKAAVRWESAASGPAARRAATMRPRSLTSPWPTA